MANERYSGPLIWIDLEMTGLELRVDTILEISTIITDNLLEVIAKGPTFVIHQSNEVLDAMDDWNKKHHGASGLIDAVRASTIDIKQAEERTLEFIKQHVVKNMAPLCGNSVWQDRIFLAKYMPNLETYLNYRIIDVSSVKEVIRRWYPNNSNALFKKPDNHRAEEDIIYSVAELKHYKTHFFVQN